MHHLQHLMLFTSFPSPLLPFILSPPPLPSPSSPPSPPLSFADQEATKWRRL